MTSVADPLRERRRRAYLRSTGRPLMVSGAPVREVLARVRSYHARGMSHTQMAEQAGVPRTTIVMAVHRGNDQMRRSSFQPLRRLKFEEPDPRSYVDPTGTRRRLAALWRDGFPLPYLAQELGTDRLNLQKTIRGLRGRTSVTYARAKAVRELYDKLLMTRPEEVGVRPPSIRHASTLAEQRGCAPRKCWDPYSIDDPEAHPEWTGACGTPAGYEIHRREGIPYCDPCRKMQAMRQMLFRKFSAARFAALRKSRGYSQQALEEAADLPNGQVSKWEGGRYRPRPDRLFHILALLDATLEDVLEEADG